ncbi:MAG TPA: YfhO family protein [Patescibacteria group bacterium]
MKTKRNSLAIILFFIVTCIFFYKTVLHGFIPFPGDLLINTYNPWRAYSYLGYNPGSFPTKAQYFDVLRQMYPWKTFALSQIRDGQFPLWNPYNFSGTPLFANFQSAILYPLNIFYIFLPQFIGWTILVFLQPFLALIFTYFYAKKIKLGNISSFFAAISYAFSSFFVVWLEYNTVGQVILWLPLALLAVENLLERRSATWISVFIFSLVASLLAGHPQIFAYLLLSIVTYIVFRVFSLHKIKKISEFAFFFLLIAISVGICAMQLLPGLELISQSARSSHDYLFFTSKILIQPWQFIMMFIPDFFGNPAVRTYWLSDTYIGDFATIGILPLLFVFLAFSKWREKLVRFYFLFALFILFFVSANPITDFFYKFQIPFISSSAPTLAMFLFCFSLSILAGFGLDIVKNEKFHLKKILIWFGSFLFVLGVCIIIPIIFERLNKEHLLIAAKSSIYSIGVLFLGILILLSYLFKNKKIALLLFLIIILQLVDSWRFFNKFNPFIPKTLVFPQANVLTFLQKQNSIDRFWSYGASSIEANFATQEHIYSPNGYDPLYPKWYGEFIQSSNNGNIITQFTDQTRSDAVIATADTKDFEQNKSRQKVLNLLGVSYIIDTLSNNSTEKTFPPNLYEKIYQDSAFTIFKNNSALPRVFLASSYETYSSASDFSKKFFNPSFPLTTILLEHPVSTVLSQEPSSMQLLSYLPNSIFLTTESKGNKLLFLSDTYYPGWKAYIDNKETPILKADYAFRAILIPPGAHKVIFTFESASFKIGSILSVLSLLLAVGTGVYFATAKRHGKK